MKLNKATKTIMRQCQQLGVDISFSDDEISIYWRKLQINTLPEDLGITLNAIAILSAMRLEDL